CSAYADSNVLF
nr:immunoglobulin light chain junction region [Macaca mulatta]MPO11123.1 immunoglobulin light chain junction region [Macaca mulatta]MPO13398.1 immunoglobulin light chain junction region [Macaca mulatta]